MTGKTQSKCGSGLARESGVSVNEFVADTPLSRASPLPQFDPHRSDTTAVIQRPKRCLSDSYSGRTSANS
ncbi:hypothetical protein FFI16_005800 [Pseudomonas sp. KBS0710]|nr:hypothetical protein FFI16_005800 [Pseudomonas sp. KBS0710]